MRILIGILSCKKHAARRDACRAAWLQSLSDHADIQACFVVGSEEHGVPALGGDTLFVPCPDGYHELPRKTFWLATFASKMGFDFLFKCDDDTFVHVDRLATLLERDPATDYRGYEVCPGVASGGAGYLLSSRSVAQIAAADSLKGAAGAEDVLIARRLSAQGIELTHDDRFWPWVGRVPTVWNRQITSHYIQPAEMFQLDQSVRTDPTPLFRVTNGYTEYGALGVNGFRGFNVGGVAMVQMPSECAFSPSKLISAHASSWVEVETAVPLDVVGFLDAAATDFTSPVEMTVDGEGVGRVVRPGDRTRGTILMPGRHRLEARSMGHNARRYTVWSLDAETAG